jgi:hypothetical protein
MNVVLDTGAMLIRSRQPASRCFTNGSAVANRLSHSMEMARKFGT